MTVARPRPWAESRTNRPHGPARRGDSGTFRPAIDVVTPDIAIVSTENDVVTPDNGIVSTENDVVTPDTGAVRPGIAVVTPDTGVVSTENLVVTPDTGVVRPGIGGSAVSHPLGVLLVEDLLNGDELDPAVGAFVAVTRTVASNQLIVPS